MKNIYLFSSKLEMGKAAAAKGAEAIQKALEKSGHANIILATGASQFEMLQSLLEHSIDWSKVTIFHLDEYLGLSGQHPASFRKYLKERFVNYIQPSAFYAINGETQPEEECRRLGEIIQKVVIHVAFVGIGENGHLAFNDPPADFITKEPYLVVSLDLECRKQQLGEGWFESLEAVPKRAISMSINQIMLSETIICTGPDDRKAVAVKNSLEGNVNPDVPASILQKHSSCFYFFDYAAASLLNQDTNEK